MTPKERQLFAALHAKLISKPFTEFDIFAPLILLRDHVGDGPVRELAQHAAHSNRNQGKLFRHVFENKRVLDKLGRKSGTVISGSIFTVEEFRRSINHGLSRFQLSQIDEPTAELVLLCAMSLLQGARVSNGKSAGELSISLTAAQFELDATFPVKHQGKEIQMTTVALQVPNRWLPICNPRAHVKPLRLVQIVVHEGHPHVEDFKPFEVQIERSPSLSATD